MRFVCTCAEKSVTKLFHNYQYICLERDRSQKHELVVFLGSFIMKIFMLVLFLGIGNYPANKVQSQTKREKNSGPVSSEA